MSDIQFKRGPASRLPTSAKAGEPIYCPDTGQLFIGNGAGKPLTDTRGSIGPQGPEGAQGQPGQRGVQGPVGPQGPQGDDGPNLISGNTATAYTGILKGNGTTVGQAVAGTDYVSSSAFLVYASDYTTLAGAVTATPVGGWLDGGGKTYTVATTLVVPSTMKLRNITIIGTMTNGSPVVQVSAGQGLTLENVTIQGYTNGTFFNDFLAGAQNAPNCIGLKFVGAVTRWHMKAVKIVACKTGWDFSDASGGAWIGDGAVYVGTCEVGIKGTNLNSVSIQLSMENNRQDLALSICYGLSLPGYMSEGANTSGVVASTIDNSSGITMDAPYFEWVSRHVPYITFGSVEQVRAIEITGLFGMGAGDTSTPILAFDKADGVDISGDFSLNTPYYTTVQTTWKTKNYRPRFALNASKQGITDNSYRMKPIYNYWPNSTLDAWLSGWGKIQIANGAVTRETGMVRHTNAMRLTAASSAGAAPTTYVSTVMQTPVISLPTALRNKPLVAFAWVYVPDVPAFDRNQSDYFTVDILVQSYDGATIVNSPYASSQTVIPGQWNFIASDRGLTPFTIQSGATGVYHTVQMRNTHGTYVATGSEYIIIGEIGVVDAYSNMSDIAAGRYQDSPLNPCRVSDGHIALYSTSVPTNDSFTQYNAGDKILFPSPSGSLGKVCVTAGVGIGAIWSDFGHLNLGTAAAHAEDDFLQPVGLPVYADNAAATTGGLAVGKPYRTATGQLMVRY